MKRKNPTRRFPRMGRCALWTIAALTILRVWFGASPVLPTARAQIPDSGKQRLSILKEAQLTNKLLADIKGLLERGTLNVRVEGADN